jgi:hypothetical protein
MLSLADYWARARTTDTIDNQLEKGFELADDSKFKLSLTV